MSRKTRKLMWSAPLVAVLAIAGALTMFMTAAPNGAQADHVDLPGAVSNLKVAAKSTAAVDLDWTAPSTGGAPTGYRIDISDDGHTWMSVSADTGDASTAYRDENVASFLGESRFYRVFALNEAGTGPVSRTAGPVMVPGSGAPGNVTGLIATATGPKSIRLTWTAPASTGGTDAITKYIIAGNKDMDPNISDTMAWERVLPDDSDPDGDVVRFATPDAATSYELDGLMPNETWSFEVFAFNGEKVSLPPAPETRSATTGGLGKIGAATGLTAVSQPAGFAPDRPQIELYWYQPDDTGGHTIDDWKVERRERDGSEPWTEFKPLSGEGGFSEGFDNPDRSFDVADRVSGALNPDHTYQYRVTPMAGMVMGEPSLSNVVKPYAYVNCNSDAQRDADQERRCDLKDVILANNDVKAERDGKGNVEITLTRSNGNDAIRATSFRIDVSSDGKMWRPVEEYTGNLGADAELVYEYLDETTGGQLHYRVLSYVGTQQLLPANMKPATAAIKPVDKPGKVQSLAARAVSPTQIDVTWSAPAQDGGANIDMYCVQISEDNEFDMLATDTAQGTDNPLLDKNDTAISLCRADTANGDDEFERTSRTSYSHQGLMAGNLRYYKVYAINNPVVGGDNRGESSDKVSATTLKQDMPGMPAGLVAEAARDSNYGGRANSGVYLLWNKAEAPAGGEIFAYTIQRKVDDGDWAVLEGNTGNARTVYHDTSEPATDEQRIYRVAALNGDKKAGGWSDMAYYPAKVIVHDTALGAPTNVMATVDDSDPGSTSVTVTWTNGVNADRHIAVLFDANWEFHPSHIGTAQTDGMVTFENVQPGAYHAVVVSIEDNNQGNAVNFLYDTASVTVGAGN